MGKPLYKIFTIFRCVYTISLHQQSILPLRIKQKERKMNSNQIRKMSSLVVMVCFWALFISAYADAFPPGMGGPDMLGEGDPMPACGIWHDLEMVERLQLTSEQVRALKDTDFTFRKTQLELGAQCDLLHLRLARAFSEDTADEASIQKVAQQLADLNVKMFVQDILLRLQTDKILTLEQRKKLRGFASTESFWRSPDPERPNESQPGEP
jgi:Spy/CpxP family protein refolding chaperone